MFGPFSFWWSLPLLRAVPGVDVLADLVRGKPVAFLKLSFELFAAAIDEV
jgi:hypothetical protein